MNIEQRIEALAPTRQIKAGIDNYTQEGADMLLAALDGVEVGKYEEAVAEMIGKVLAERDRDVRALARELRAALSGSPTLGGGAAAKELLAKAHWHGWFCRERLHGPDLGPFDYPAGLDYEGQEDYAFEKFYNSVSTQEALAPSPAAALVPGEAGGGWVSVAERLPEPTMDGDKAIWELVMIARESCGSIARVGYYNAYEQQWRGVQLEYLDDVTHWCELPAAPTQAGKEQTNG